MAQEEARFFQTNEINLEHLFLALVAEEEGVAAEALHRLGITDHEGLRMLVTTGQYRPSGHIPFTKAAKKMLEASLSESLQLGHNYIGTEHLLLAMMRPDIESGGVRDILARFKVKPIDVRESVLGVLKESLPKEQARKPESWVTVDRDALVDAAEAWLCDQPFTVWPRLYDIEQPDSRRKAAEFAADLVLDLTKYLETRS